MTLLQNSQLPKLHLNLESKVKELPLYDIEIDKDSPGKEIADAFQSNSLLPGVILTKQGKYSGVLSQRQFLEIMSKPYALELFSERSISSLCRFINPEIFTVPGDLEISEAARRSLQRLDYLIYEPLLVEIEPSVYRLLSIHDLLIADSQIHQLACDLLQEKMNRQTLELSRQIEKIASLGSAEKVTNLNDIKASITSEIENPAYWNQTLNILFIYCKSMRQVLLDYETSATQEHSGTYNFFGEIKENLILSKLPETLKIMHTDSTRLTKFIGGLQILLKRM